MINFAEVKKFLVFTLIGSLVAAALAAVVTVLIGEFNDVAGRVFSTLALVVIHSLASLLFIWDDSRRNTFTKLPFFINTIFFLIAASLVGALFGVWDIISEKTLSNFYQTIFIIAFASFHADILSKALRREKYIDAIVYANYAFIAGVVLMLQPIIYIDDNAFEVLGELYYRILAAVGIIDGTLSILTVIFYKLYMHKHPEVIDIPKERKRLSVWIWILIIFLLWMTLSSFFRAMAWMMMGPSF